MYKNILNPISRFTMVFSYKSVFKVNNIRAVTKNMNHYQKLVWILHQRLCKVDNSNCYL